MQGVKTNTDKLYTLIPLEDFKALLSIDDREDKICRFCLVTATLTIEQYCKRRLLRKKHFETLEFYGDLVLPLKEYPVSKVLAVSVCGNGEILEPDFYQVLPDCNSEVDLPFFISLSPALKRYRRLKAVKVIYWAGYPANRVPADLAAACLELAAWNLNRYRGKEKREGRKEESMPANVRQLLEPYRRKTI